MSSRYFAQRNIRDPAAASSHAAPGSRLSRCARGRDDTVSRLRRDRQRHARLRRAGRRRGRRQAQPLHRRRRVRRRGRSLGLRQVDPDEARDGAAVSPGRQHQRSAARKVTGPLKIAGMAFQAPSLLPWRTHAREHPAAARDRAAAQRSACAPSAPPTSPRSRRCWRRSASSGMGAKYPWELSGGMQQRASLCRALIHEPRLLMLDEPFAALDSFTREELWCVMRDLHAARPVTIILVTHDLREAAFLADRIFCMSARPGRIIAERRVAFPRPRSLEVTYTQRVHRSRPRSAVADRQREAGLMRAGTQRGAIAAAPYVFTIVFFALWEAACRLLQDPAVLPAGAQRHRPGHGRVLVAAAVPLLPHAVDDACRLRHRRGVRHPARHRARRLAHRQRRHPAVAGRLQCHPQGGGGADPDLVVRGRLGPAGHDGVPDLVLPDRRQRGDRPLHHRAGAGGRHEGAGREEVGHPRQDRHPALDALPLRLAEGGHHAGLRRLGDRRVQCLATTASAT